MDLFQVLLTGGPKATRVLNLKSYDNRTFCCPRTAISPAISPPHQCDNEVILTSLLDHPSHYDKIYCLPHRDRVRQQKQLGRQEKWNVPLLSSSRMSKNWPRVSWVASLTFVPVSEPCKSPGQEGLWFVGLTQHLTHETGGCGCNIRLIIFHPKYLTHTLKDVYFIQV